MMRTMILLCFIGLVLPQAALAAEKFLGVPVVPDSEVLKKTKKRMEVKSPLTHDGALDFYKGAFEGMEDIKIRDWQDETYIEDDSNRPWHSVRISKTEAQGTTVTIMKDNWTWIIGTLILRYVGVFVVLLSLFIGLAISGKVLSTFFGVKTA